MELKPGYKQTEVGVLPEDWNVNPLSVFADVKTGPFGSALHERDYVNDGTPIITVEHLSEQGVVHENLPLVSDSDRNRLSSYSLRAGDIVFSRVGSVDRNALIRDSESGWLFSGRLLRVRVLRCDVHPPYLSFHFHSEAFKQRVRTVAVGQTMASLNTQILKGIYAVLPTEEEQRAIATALSDMDALLDGLDRLIAKKRDLKQAAMQQLLTGETRLPGFEGEWEVKRLGELATFHKGKGLPKSALSPYSTEPCIHYGELFTQYGESIIETISRTHKMYDEFRSVANDVLMPTSDVTPRGLAKASCVLIDGVILGGDILVIRTNPSEVSGTFLSYVIRREEDQVLRLVTGTTVFHLYGADMKKFTLKLPSLIEQQKIVAVLSDMDAEIAALEQRRAKTKDIKQAMMQELLTGKTRLI